MFRNKKQNWSPYTSDMRKISIYPPVRTTETRSKLKVGDTLVVDVHDLDEKGRGIVDYKDVKLIIPNAISGARLKVKIVKITGVVALAHIAGVLSESNTDY